MATFNQPSPSLTFGQAVKHVFDNYATFTGRARRSEYWYFALFYFIVSLIAGILDIALGFNTGSIGILQGLVSLALVLPSLAVFIRRMHDIGRSGWWFFLGFIPLIGTIVLLVFCCTDSKPEANKYGPSPKYGDNDFEEVVL